MPEIPTDWRTCSLEIEALGGFETWEDAWKTLPHQGQGWVMAPDAVLRFAPSSARRFLAAEVSDGGDTSVNVRFDGDRWNAWRYGRRDGTTHRERIRRFAAVRVEGGPPGALEYAEYWHFAADPLDPAMKVWTPCAARFLRFVTEES